MTTWLTADLHLEHGNILKYCRRPFDSVEEMNRAILDFWFTHVKEEDTLYILGDFWWNRRMKHPLTPEFFTNLGYPGVPPGKLYLIRGNHDKECDTWPFFDVRDRVTLDIDIGLKYPMPLVMNHYAMRVWDRSHFGSFHVYGHSHGTLPGYGRSMDVGVDTNNFKFYELWNVVDRLMDIDYTLTHGIKE